MSRGLGVGLGVGHAVGVGRARWLKLLHVSRPSATTATSNATPALDPRRTGSGRQVLDSGQDTKFTASFDEVFRSEGIRIIRTPVRSPRTNAFAERFVGTMRRECLDRMVVFNRRQLEAVLSEFVDHYNGHRPHRSLEQALPLSKPWPPAPILSPGPTLLRRSDRLGGLIHEYELAA